MNLETVAEDRTLLIVDDDASFGQRQDRAMEKRGFIPETADRVAHAAVL
jgi:two-component system response regulator RegA